MRSNGERKTVYRRRLRPTPNLEDRGWFDVSVPLDAWAGRDVVLEFTTETDEEKGQTLLMSGWELPRIVTGSVPVTR